MSGAGETELQLQKRRIQERRNHLLSQIVDVHCTRALQLLARGMVVHKGKALPLLPSLVIQMLLFATVDPLLRSVILPSGKKVILSDTVGFISDLPVQLVEAFHATLEEVAEADLLVCNKCGGAKDISVLQLLQQIGDEKISNLIEVWNKIDLLNENKANVLADDLYKTTKEAQEDELGLMDSPFGEIVDEDVNSEHENKKLIVRSLLLIMSISNLKLEIAIPMSPRISLRILVDLLTTKLLVSNVWKPLLLWESACRSYCILSMKN